MSVFNFPGFTAERSLYNTGKGYFTNAASLNMASKKSGGVQPAAYGCSPCILYTEPGPGGRSAGIRTCCKLTCRTTIFGKFRCYEYCMQEICATFSAGEFIV